ncbi:MAG TPA: alpha/beta hydrolase-fold protein [Candidatus Didemnitutus sp.]
MPKPTFKLPSPETGTEYWIWVESVGAGTGPRFPMLFLDGDDQFGPAVTAAEKEMTAASRPLLLIGVGYGASYGKPANKRGRDYTPTRHSDEPASGGADRFALFIENTLWPELSRRYPLDPASRAIGGHSLSSLFGLYALFQPRPFFTHVLASAPSIWWDDRSILAQLAKLRDRQVQLPGRLFLGVGEDDSVSMTKDLNLLLQQFEARPLAGLEIAYRRYPGLNHYNSLPAIFAAGIDWLVSG